MIRIILQCALVFLVSRGMLEAIGVGARLLAYPVMDPQFHRAAFSTSMWLDIWGVWDSEWFLGIVRDGYDTVVRSAAGIEGQANWAFFPLYPMLAWAVSELSGVSAFPALLIVSNVAFFLALLLIRVEASHLYGERAGGLAIALFAFMPGSFVFSSAYSESLFLLFVMLCLAFARREDWLLAGIAAACATLTRNLGILLVVPLLLYAAQAHGGWRDSEVLWRRRLEVVAATALPVIALGGFMLFLWQRTGDGIAFASVQTAWNRELQNPLIALIGPFWAAPNIQTEIYPSIVMAWVSVAATFALILRRNWPHAGYMVAVITITLASGVLSYFRFFLTMAPCVMVLAAYAARYPQAGPAGIALLALANGALMVSWALGLGIY